MELKEKLLKKQREYINNKSNKSLILCIIIFFCGYGFFFSTSLIFPPAFQGLEITKIGVPKEQNDRTVTLDSWTYSKEEKAMEVMIEIDNDSLDGNDKYKWSALDKEGKLKTKVVYETPKFVVLKISGLRWRWTEIRVDMDSIDDDESFIKIKFYTNSKKVKKVAKIEDKGILEYKKVAMESKVTNIEKHLKKKEKELDKTNKKLSLVTNRIKDLENQNVKMTEKEKEENVRKIEQHKSKKEYIKDEVIALQKDIKELKERIKYAKEMK